MTLEQICHAVAIRAGVAPSPTWAPAADDTAAEILQAVQEATETVARAHDWRQLVRTHVAALTPDQEQMVALPNDFARLIPRTAYLGSVPVAGPLTDEEMETLLRTGHGAATPVFAVDGDALRLLASPVSGDTLSFRYICHPVISNGVAVPRWQLDSDTTPLDARLIVLGALAVWRDSKGLDARMAAAQFAAALAQAKAQNAPIGVMGLGARRVGFSPRANADGSVTLRP